MKTSSYGNFFPYVRGIHLSPVSDVELCCFFFICTWINNSVNSHGPGDLRCHPANYDIIVMVEYATKWECHELPIPTDPYQVFVTLSLPSHLICPLLKLMKLSFYYINGLMQERSALAMELCLSCIKLSIYAVKVTTFIHLSEYVSWYERLCSHCPI